MAPTTEKIAVYAGTFDPITNGHVDIIQRALRIFDRLVVAVGLSSTKTPVFPAETRIKLIQASVAENASRVSVQGFEGLLVDFVRAQGTTIIVRGLRAVSDYEYEAQMAMINRKISKEIETVYFVTSEKCSFISSSIVKEVARHGGDLSALVPAPVEAALREKFPSKKSV